MIAESFYQDYLRELLAGNRGGCHQAASALLDQGEDVKTIYVDLFQRSLYEVGELWERNRISVSVEHLATAITESLLTLMYPRLFASPRKGHKAVVSSAANEMHQLGGKMVADLLEMNGWDSYFLGANTPVADLVDLVGEKSPNLVCLSLAVYMNMVNLIESLQELNEHFPNLPVLVGGQAFQLGGADAVGRFPNARLVSSLDELEAYLEGFQPAPASFAP
jgi:methanogenic corrinoid protein MtbC1